jgi:branched-subunit amino acid permease
MKERQGHAGRIINRDSFAKAAGCILVIGPAYAIPRVRLQVDARPFEPFSSLPGIQHPYPTTSHL